MHQVAGGFVGAGEPRADHDVGRARGQRQRDVARMPDAAVGPDVTPSCRAAAAHSATAENCGRPTPVIMRVVHIAPGPTPTLTMVAPALDQVAGALRGHHVARGQRHARDRATATGLKRVEHLGLMAVRGVDDQQVDTGFDERRGLGGHVAVDADGRGDPQPTRASTAGW